MKLWYHEYILFLRQNLDKYTHVPVGDKTKTLQLNMNCLRKPKTISKLHKYDQPKKYNDEGWHHTS